MTADGSGLIGITGERGNRLCQPDVPYDVHKRRVCDDDLECLLYRGLPVRLDDEGSEALETIDGAVGNKLFIL